MTRALRLVALWALALSSCSDKETKKEPASAEPSTAAAPNAPARPTGSPSQRCEQGDMEGCRQQGVILSRGASPEERQKSSELFARACDAGNGAACSNLGLNFVAGVADDKDPAKGLSYFDKGCELRHGLGCRNAGLAYLVGDGADKDPAKARAYFDEGCEIGAALSCTNLAMALRDGVGGERKMERAVQTFTRACDLGDATACRHLGAMYATGEGLPPSRGSASVWFERACAGKDAPGCTALGVILLDSGTEQDREAAKGALGRACDLGEMGACEMMAKEGWVTKTVETKTLGAPGADGGAAPAP